MSHTSPPSLPEIILDPPGRMRYVARFISNVLSPPLVAIGIVIGMGLAVVNEPREALKWMLVAIALAGVPPLAYIIYLVRTGYLTDIHMPNREKRIKPLLVTITWFLVALGVLYTWQAPRVVVLLLAATIFQVALMAAITLAWKISFHGATIASAATLTILMSSTSAWAVVSLVPLVGWSRVRLKRHTPWEVVFGCLAGIAVAVVVFFFTSPYLLITSP
jgi:membrane-associated phospholipid phosphatase